MEIPTVVYLAVHHVEDILQDSDLKQLMAELPQHDRDRIGRFRRPRDQRQRLAGTLLLRRALSRAIGRDFENVPIQRTTRGRPFVDSLVYPGDFNLSHHGAWLAVAWTAHGRVGVDLAGIGQVRLKVAQYVCSNEEIAYLDGLAEEPQAQALATLWALKEAYTKAVGFGMSRQAQQLSFRPKVGQPQFTLFGADPAWTFSVLEAAPATVAAIATDRPHQVRSASLTPLESPRVRVDL